MGLFSRRNKSATPPPPSIAGIPDEAVASQDFDIVVRQLITQMSPDGADLVETDGDLVKVGDAEVFLGNFRKGWAKRSQGEREVWLRDALHGIFLSELRDTSTLDLSMLRPGIRSEWMLNAPVLSASAQRGGQQISHGMANRSLGPGLLRVLLWDTPTTMAMISEAQIADWGSDFDTLWAVAVENLAKDPTADGWGCANDCCWMPVHTDDYTAERLFIDGFLDPTGLAGDVVIFHPNRETLIVVDPNDAAGIELGAKLALSRAGDPNPVTLLPYIGRGFSWTPLILPEGHPAEAAVVQLRVSELSPTYAQQKDLLAAIHGEDLFVATYMAYQADERIVTVASWTEGIVSLLPRAQTISFTFGLDDPQPQTVMVPWDAAQQIVGNQLEPTGHWPERWRVSTFPTPQQMEQLRSVATQP